ncbi:hypothetical protein [Paenibacillus physcomitrellae]|uniref:Heptaprenyl diphosphate synthase n=1 Tax=Paenibacillus physcomitrellae TaxID=1619311 RepID=A0ABQ1FV88_9BACL|nr:hypothetical protein [Paenibacillus physcomitrellae]GGA31760.1 hypothetical protein GCM10010917_16110 [Paenibacillus physcomitrellae]
MNNSLIPDASRLLQTQLAPESGIAPEASEVSLLLSDAARILEASPLPPLRSARILALYLAVALAMQYHEQCENAENRLARNLLDGDYLYSLYLDLALKWEEYDLVALLAPAIKKVQIGRAEGRPQDELLVQGLSRFVRTESKTLQEAAQPLAAEAM